MKRIFEHLSLALLFVFASVSLAVAEEDLIKCDGSSTVFPITEAVAEEFQAAKLGARVIVGQSGTGGGFKKFCRGETDISNASRPIKPSEMELCKQNGIEYIELLIAFDGLAIVVNKENTWLKSITVEELKKIWQPEAQGKLTKWNQLDPAMPDKEIRLFGPGTDSGTFDYFTEVIMGKSGQSRGDYTASEDDNVLVQGVAFDKYALGYFGVAYYEENKDKLKVVPVDDGIAENGAGPQLPSIENINTGVYQPLSRPVFIYVNKKAKERKSVAKFVEFYLKKAAELSREVGFVPLPAKTYELMLKRFEKGDTGTVFGGKDPKKTQKIEDLLK